MEESACNRIIDCIIVLHYASKKMRRKTFETWVGVRPSSLEQSHFNEKTIRTLERKSLVLFFNLYSAFSSEITDVMNFKT